MKVSVERLRIWLLAGACLLVLVVGGFLGYARYRAHRFFRDLPKKLGVDIRRETNGYTLSQSVQGRTVYTIHAAKAVERVDGKVTLHDVGIVLYGRNNDRDDRIYGNEFVYDQKAEVIRAVGEVHIDLEAPEAADASKKMDYAAGKDLHGSGGSGGSSGSEEVKDARLIHVTTSGLVFLRKLGVAATENEIEFESGGMSGHALGADYNSDTGVVVLHSEVKVNGLQHDRPVVLTATRAELDRPEQKVTLTEAKYVAVGESGNGTGGSETAEGRHVVVHLRKDGSAERVEAEGEVILTDGEGGKVNAPGGEMMLSGQNQPRSAVLSGGVRYVASDALRETQGEAVEGRAAFDAMGRPQHVVMSGAVHLRERTRASQEAPWSERELHAGTAEVALDTGGNGRAHLRDAKASGDAKLTVITAAIQGDKTRPASSDLAADVLTAHLIEIDGKDHLAEVHGDGHAVLHRVDAKGVVNTSSADSLVAHFRPVAAMGSGTGRIKDQAAPGHAAQQADAIADVVEQGHVLMTQLAAKKPGEATAPLEQRATAQRAMYDGGLARTTLTGDVQVSDSASVLWADKVVSEQQSGDAVAEGSVKVSFTQSGGAGDPVHVLATRAVMKRDTQVGVFYGDAQTLARLWQGGSQVDAPVLEFDQKQRRLRAHGSGRDGNMPVHTVLTSRDGVTKVPGGQAAAKVSAARGRAEVIRVQSGELAFSDQTRRADFTGGVEVESADGRMRGKQTEVYFTAAPAPTPAAVNSRTGRGSADDLFGGNVDRIVASGDIAMEQPGRRATGERVVYTAGDGMFVLTGTTAVLPKVMDNVRGVVTGTSLQFHAGDDSVVVSNGGGGAGQRVRTETRVKNKR